MLRPIMYGRVLNSKKYKKLRNTMGNIKNKILDISSVGLTDMTGTAIVAVFWFYIASQLGPENYGELTYLISIASLASGIALFGSNYTVWVMAAKKIDIQATIFLITGISSIIGFAIVFISSLMLV